VIEDASIDLWAEVTPRLSEAIGVAVDQAVFAGTGKPATWPAAIIPAALAAGNEVTAATPDADDYNALFGTVEGDGFMVTDVYASVASKAGFRGMNASGVPIYLTDIRDDGRVDSIYGEPIQYDTAGVLGAGVHALAGDASKAILGTRTDIQFKVLTEAMIDISAAQDGSAMINLAQQDSVALRVRARFGFAVANPPTKLNPTASTRYPFGVLNAA
jgi:HK97 family phage major capsid protein